MKKAVTIMTILSLILVLLTGGAAAGENEGAAPEENPGDVATIAFPIGVKRAVYIENENVKAIALRIEDAEEPTVCYVVPEEKAHIRMEISWQDNLFKMAYRDFEEPCLYITDLYDEECGAFIHDQTVEGTAEGKSCSFSYGKLADEEHFGEDPDGIRFFLIRDEQCLEEVIAFLAENGEKVSGWEYTETEQPAKNKRMAYTVHVVDQEGQPVEEAAVNFCTDASCVPRESDQNGLITFNGMPAVYHIQLVDVPEGYSYDEDFEFYTDSVYGEWVLRIRKD